MNPIYAVWNPLIAAPTVAINGTVPHAMPTTPELCIGMPVYNGETYMAAAIESILSQSHADLRLVICDNSSSDGTADIANTYVNADDRVLYLRNRSNLGAHPNYNRCYYACESPYFKWCNYDDLLEPGYATACLEHLRSDPGAVLCQSRIAYVDADAQPIGVYDSRLLGSDDTRASTRWGALINRPHTCYEVFGVFRRSALARTDRLHSFHGADRLLLAHMALLGRFHQLPEPLMKLRDHADRYTRKLRKPRDRAVWHDARLRGRLSLPTWRLYSEYLRLLRRESGLLGQAELLRCIASALRWWTTDRNAIRMATDLLAAANPDLVIRLQDHRRRIFGSARAPDDDLAPNESTSL